MCLINFLLTCLNFFFLDRDVETCASYHGDKHLNKMQLEYAQIASTVVRQLSKDVPDGTYKETHKNHPVVKWAKKSRSHVMWIIDLGIALDKEKAKRAVIAKKHGKKWAATHKSQVILKMLKEKMLDESYFENGNKWSDPPACMPECVRNCEPNSVINAYRLYYASLKIDLTGLKWLPYAEEPSFLNEFKKKGRESQEIQEYIKKQKI